MKGSLKLAAVLLGLSLTLVGPPVFSQSERTATITQTKGLVEMRVAGGDWEPAELGAVLHEADEIRTSEGGYAEIQLDNKGSAGQLELKEKSLLKLNTLGLDPESGEKTTYLDLALGKVLVHAEKLRGDSKFEVRTPTATTGVKGTIFEVSVDEEG